MSVFRTPCADLPPIPDDITIPQFILDYHPPFRPLRPSHVPWLLQDQSDRTLSQSEVRKRTYDLANGFKAKFHLRDGDVVCIFSPNDVDYLPAIWAVHLVGGIVTPSNPSYTVDELVHQLQLTEAALVIVHPVFLRAAAAAAKIAGLSEDRIVLLHRTADTTNVTLDELVEFSNQQQSTYTPKRLRPGEARTKLAFLSFSSGTTGKPKAVAIPHYAVMVNVIQSAFHYGVTDPSSQEVLFAPGDVALGALPLFHIYGLVFVSHTSLFLGLSFLIVSRFNFTDFLKSLTRYRVTHLFFVPPQAVLLCKASLAGLDLSHVKYCVSGAAPLSGQLMHKLRKVLPNATIGQGYGMTETCTTIAIVPPDQKFGTVGSAGRLLPGVLARVMKPDGSLAKEGEAGELIVTGPSMALGYYKNPEATKETFVDGWVRTGDEVIIKNYEVFIIDRLKEIIKVRGFQVAPAELEGHLLLRSDVADACVVSILDDYSGELPLAYVMPSPSVAARITADPTEAQKYKETLIKYVSDTKVNYKKLAGGVELIDAIPKNPSGKILRRILREKARTLRAGGQRSKL